MDETDENKIRYVNADQYWLVRLSLYIGYFGIALGIFAFSILGVYMLFNYIT